MRLKSFVLLLVLLISLPVMARIVQSASAPPTPSPIEVLLNSIRSVYNFLKDNIAPSLTNIDNKISSIEEKVDSSNATQILFYNYSYVDIEGLGAEEFTFTTDKPALFTVYVAVGPFRGMDLAIVSVYGETDEVVAVTHFDVDQPDQSTPFTVGGYGIKIAIWNSDSTENISAFWTIIVEGTPGTIVTVGG